jgi:hypothetical protein
MTSATHDFAMHKSPAVSARGYNCAQAECKIPIRRFDLLAFPPINFILFRITK